MKLKADEIVEAFGSQILDGHHRLAAFASMVDADYTLVRVDDGTKPFVRAYEITILVKAPVPWKVWTSRVLDLTDGSALAEQISPELLSKLREDIDDKAQERTKHRAIRLLVESFLGEQITLRKPPWSAESTRG